MRAMVTGEPLEIVKQPTKKAALLMGIAAVEIANAPHRIVRPKLVKPPPVTIVSGTTTVPVQP